jgi:hypothetical protein
LRSCQTRGPRSFSHRGAPEHERLHAKNQPSAATPPIVAATPRRSTGWFPAAAIRHSPRPQRSAVCRSRRTDRPAAPVDRSATGPKNSRRRRLREDGGQHVATRHAAGGVGRDRPISPPAEKNAPSGTSCPQIPQHRPPSTAPPHQEAPRAR